MSVTMRMILYGVDAVGNGSQGFPGIGPGFGRAFVFIETRRRRVAEPIGDGCNWMAGLRVRAHNARACV